MRRFSAILGVLFLVSPALAGGPEFDHPHTNLGPTNFEGKVYSWIEVAGIKLSDGEKLPLRLLFSVQPPSGIPVFGKFWWCPLAESTLVPVSERCSLLSTLGGSNVYLVKQKDGSLASGDGAWKGKPGTKDLVELASPDGWSYTYRGGRITDAVSSGGTRLHWAYENNLFKSLSDSEKGPLLSFDYGAQGLPARISTPANAFECEVQKVPVVANAAGVISGFEFSLAAISSKLQAWKFPIEMGEDGNYTMPLSIPFEAANKYIWSAKSGILQSEGGWTYEVKPKADGRPVVSRKNKSGGVESYFYDEQTGISEQRVPDGRVITRSYFLAGGPTQGKIRKYQELLNGVEKVAIHSSYDEAGRIIRQRTGAKELVWTYYKNGLLASFESLRDGNSVESIKYDETGRLTEKFGGLAAYKYSYEGGKTVTQKILGGKVCATKVEDPRTHESAIFVQSPDGSLKPGSAFPLANSPPSQEWINSAATLAGRTLSKTISPNTQ